MQIRSNLSAANPKYFRLTFYDFFHFTSLVTLSLSTLSYNCPVKHNSKFAGIMSC